MTLLLGNKPALAATDAEKLAAWPEMVATVEAQSAALHQVQILCATLDEENARQRADFMRAYSHGYVRASI